MNLDVQISLQAQYFVGHHRRADCMAGAALCRCRGRHSTLMYFANLEVRTLKCRFRGRRSTLKCRFRPQMLAWLVTALPEPQFASICHPPTEQKPQQHGAFLSFESALMGEKRCPYERSRFSRAHGRRDRGIKTSRSERKGPRRAGQASKPWKPKKKKTKENGVTTTITTTITTIIATITPTTITTTTITAVIASPTPSSPSSPSSPPLSPPSPFFGTHVSRSLVLLLLRL